MSAKVRKHVFVEVCCGTKSMAKVAKAYDEGNMVVYTVDVDHDCIPGNAKARLNHFVADLLGGVAKTLPAGVKRHHLGGVSIADLKRVLDAHVEAGDVIYIHGSPPCDQVSKMNTVGPKNTQEYPAKLSKSLRIFHAFISLAKRYADAWTLENPATGKLWQPEWLRSKLAPADKWLADVPSIRHRCDVDYCQYGFAMQKTTGFAFSSKAMRDSFAASAKRCPGPAKCDMCIVGDNGIRKHAVSMKHLRGDYDCSTKHARYPIPPALVVRVIREMVKEAKRIKYVDRVDMSNDEGSDDPSDEHEHVDDDEDTDEHEERFERHTERRRKLRALVIPPEVHVRKRALVVPPEVHARKRATTEPTLHSPLLDDFNDPVW